MFGRDPFVPLNSLLMSIVRYLGTSENRLSLETLKNMYPFIVSNLEQARKKGDTSAPVPNIVRVIPFCLRIILQVCETLGL